MQGAMMRPLFQKILVAVNGSEYSLRAAKYAVLMALQYHCRLKAVYVVDTATIRQLAFSRLFIKAEAERIEESLCADGRKYLSLVSEFASSKELKIETELRKGAVWAELVTCAESWNADALLLGAHDSGAPGHDTASGICGEIIGSARCSVLVVKEPLADQLFRMA